MTRNCPDSATLNLAFTRAEQGTLRKSDGTVVIEGWRFAVPNRYRHLTTLEVRYASWDLSLVHMVHEQTGTVLCRLFPQDKAANASGMRRSLEPLGEAPVAAMPKRGPSGSSMAPLLTRIMIGAQSRLGG